MNEEWLNNLRNKIEQHTEPAPEGLWEEIENELFPEENKRFVILMQDTSESRKSGFKISSGIFIKAASVILFMLFTKNIITHPLATHHLASSEITPQEETETRNLVEHTRVAQKNIANDKKTSESLKIQQTEEFLPKEERIITGEIALLEYKATLKEEPIFSKAEKMILPKTEVQEIAFQEPNLPYKKRFSANFLTGQISPSSSQQHSGFTSMTAKPMETQTTIEENTFSAIVARNSQESVYTDIKHKSPVTLGVSLLYHLSPKISVGSGLVYTKLVSQLQAGSESDYISSRQTLHYIGIPMHLNYLMFEAGRFSSYVSSGASVEKGLGGTMVTQYTLNPISEDGPEEKLTDKAIQISVNALVGVQYKINSQLGIYLEPGVNYYFSNRSELSTLFKEKPMMVNTRMGLRFTLNK